MAVKTRLVIGFKDDIGVERDNMEDAAGYSMTATNMDVRRKGAIFVVADGVGGNQAGEVASNRAVNKIKQDYYASAYDDTEAALRAAISQANDAIYREAQSAGKSTMATTVVCAVIRDGILTIAHVGDSRIYLVRGNQIRQLTDDHSWVNEQIKAGVISVDDARDNPYRNVITRSLGNKPRVETEISTPGALLDNDLLILCSDGLYEGVPDEQMVEVTRRLPSVQAAEELVDMAKKGGSTDNITVMIVEAHITGEVEGTPISMEVQKPAVNEGNTEPRIALATGSAAVERMDAKPAEAPADKPEEAAPVPTIYKETPPIQPITFEKEDEPYRSVTQRPNNPRQVTQPMRETPGLASPPISQANGELGNRPQPLQRYREPELEPRMETGDPFFQRTAHGEWLVEYRSFGQKNLDKQEKSIRLPNGESLKLNFEIIDSFFIHPVTRAVYKHPIVFKIGATFDNKERISPPSRRVIGTGLYKTIQDNYGLMEISRMNMEILASGNEEIFLINTKNPLIFATIDLVEFETVQHHNAEQDFMTYLQIKVRFHVLI